MGRDLQLSVPALHACERFRYFHSACFGGADQVVDRLEVTEIVDVHCMLAWAMNQQFTNFEGFDDVLQSVDVVRVGMGGDDDVHVAGSVIGIDVFDEAFTCGAVSTVDDNDRSTPVGKGELCGDGVAAFWFPARSRFQQAGNRSGT
ncbi:hypothetical protein GCM10020255_004830 [Rhodococcus baikonurensis]